MIKASIVLFYRYIFVTPKFRLVANVTLAILTAWIVAFLFGTLFQDNPISRNWSSKGTTVDYPVFYMVEVVMDIIFDICILCMPLPVIRSLHMSTKKKWLLAGIFWLGILYIPDSLENGLSYTDGV